MGSDLAPVLAECRAILARGSKSFAAASHLLPARLRDPVAAFYAFCRVSDDAVDESLDPQSALSSLRDRLDGIYAGEPGPHPADRGLAWVVARHGLDRAPIDALLEGYAWDAEGRQYERLADVLAYSVRVAASVGVAMTLLMGVRDRRVLARAVDLGVAMQLTNIARDVGEDARPGRLYLPLEWLAGEGIDPQRFLQSPRFADGIGVCTCRLLDEADRLYARADTGVGALPPDCRTAIRAARLIYSDIGRVIRARSHDSIGARALTSTVRKLALSARAMGTFFSPPLSLDPPLSEAQFLLQAIHP